MPNVEMAPYVLAGYMGMWLILIGYLIYQGLKLSRLEEELKHLKGTLKKKG